MVKIYVELNAENEVTGWSTTSGSANEIEVEIEETHPFFSNNPFFFKLTDGVLAENETIKQRIRTERSNRQEINNLKKFMTETDFYFIRKQEENEEVPADIKTKRKEARKRLKELGL